MAIYQRLHAASLFLLCMLANMAAGQQMNAVYNAADGGVTFLYDLEYEDLAGIRIDSAGEILVSGQMTDLDGKVVTALSEPVDQAPRFVEWGNLIGFKFDSTFAGFLLPTGLTQETLDSDLTLRYRTLAAPTEDRFGQFAIVPEPQSCVLALLAFGSGMMMRRSDSSRNATCASN